MLYFTTGANWASLRARNPGAVDFLWNGKGKWWLEGLWRGAVV